MNQPVRHHWHPFRWKIAVMSPSFYKIQFFHLIDLHLQSLFSIFRYKFIHSCLMHENEIQFSTALTLHQTHTALVGGQLLNAPTWIDIL